MKPMRTFLLPAFTVVIFTVPRIFSAEVNPPVLKPGKVFDWSLICDPAANGGSGELRVTLGTESVTLALKPGQKAEGANMDRFGLFNSTAGGQMVKLYLDDITYTVGKP